MFVTVVGIAIIGVYLFCAVYTWRRARIAEQHFPPIGEFIEVEGARLHYLRRGTGRSIVLLHGSDGFLQDFTESIFGVLAQTHDTIAFDRPGHGYSELPAGERATAPAQARLIHEALARLGIDRPILVAHSWSGLLALYYAWKYPEDVASLLLLAPWIYPGRHREPLLRIASHPFVCFLVYPLFGLAREPLVRYFLRDAFRPMRVPRAYEEQASRLWLRNWRQLGATARENSGNRSALRGFAPSAIPASIPIVAVTGELDRVTPTERQLGRLQRELPHVLAQVLPGAGHELMFTERDLVIRAIQTLAASPDSHSQDRHETASNALAGAGRSSYERARELVMRFGWNSASYQILTNDMEHWFSQDGDACVGFVLRNRVRVVAGAPICAEIRLENVVEEFEADAERAGEHVCYFGAADRLRSAVSTLPHHSEIPIGAQPAWQPGSWQEIVRSNKSLRAQLNRAKNKRVTVSEWTRERAHGDAGLRRCFEEWQRTHAAFTLHFLTEPVAPDELADRRMFVAEREGEPVGFLIATPVPDRRGWLVEQIVRGRSAPNGAAELLVDFVMRTVADEGADFVTLGLAPLSRRGGTAPASRLWLRLLLGWIRAHGKRFYNFEGLDSFKAKFQPDYWEPIYAISNEAHFTVRTLYGMAAAFTDGAPVAAIAMALMSAVQQEWTWLRRPRQGTAVHSE